MSSILNQYGIPDISAVSLAAIDTRTLEHGVEMTTASIVSTQGNVLLNTDGDLNNVGGQITALKTIQGTVKGDINLTSLVEEVHNVYQKPRLLPI